MKAAPPAISIAAKLRQAWRQERRFVHLRGLARFLLWLVAMVLLDLLVDWGLIFRTRLPEQSRFLLLAINAGVLGWVGWHEWLRHLRRFDPLAVALAIERQHPALASLLVSYIQLGRTAPDQPGMSPELLAAMRDQALTVTRPMDFREVVDFRQLKNLLAVAALVLTFFAGLSVVESGYLRSLLLRLAGVNAKYPTRTRIERLSGHLVVPQGAAPEIRAAVSGRVPDSGRLYVRAGRGAAWQSLALPRPEGAAPNEFRRRLPAANASLSYFVRLGDDRSDEYTVTVIPPPEVVAAQVTCHYPAYLQRPDVTEQVSELNLEVPEGTELRWALKLDAAIRALEVSLGDRRLAAAVGADGRTAAFACLATNHFRYGFRTTEKQQGFQFDSVRHSVRIVPDRPPDVALLAPADHGLATPHKRVRIVADASDDYGLAQAWLVYSVDGSNEVRLAIAALDKAKQRVDYPLALAEKIPGLRDGQVLQFHVEVSDRYPRQPHVAQSAARRLTIVNPERYLEWFRRELDAQRDEVQKAREAEEQAATQVRELKQQEAK